MIEELMHKVLQAKTVEELLSYKSHVSELSNELYKKITKNGCSITNFDDIQNLHNLEDSMQAYYGPDFYKKSGIPFLKKHNPTTIGIIEYTVLFYTSLILEILEYDAGFFTETSLCVYDNNMVHLDRMERINLTKAEIYDYKYGWKLFTLLWDYFVKFITISGNEDTFPVYYEKGMDIFYVDSERYKDIMERSYLKYYDSDYSEIIKRILGMYKIRFTNFAYILNYQPLFVDVAYSYLNTIL